MPSRIQFVLNARCLRRAVAGREWRKLPHFHRGLCRAVLRHDQLGDTVACLWPLAALGIIGTAIVTIVL